jgi:hypothetical protein
VGQGKQREVKAFYTASLHTFVSLSRFRNEHLPHLPASFTCQGSKERNSLCDLTSTCGHFQKRRHVSSEHIIVLHLDYRINHHADATHQAHTISVRKLARTRPAPRPSPIISFVIFSYIYLKPSVLQPRPSQRRFPREFHFTELCPYREPFQQWRVPYESTEQCSTPEFGSTSCSLTHTLFQSYATIPTQSIGYGHSYTNLPACSKFSIHYYEPTYHHNPTLPARLHTDGSPHTQNIPHSKAMPVKPRPHTIPHHKHTHQQLPTTLPAFPAFPPQTNKHSTPTPTYTHKLPTPLHTHPHLINVASTTHTTTSPHPRPESSLNTPNAPTYNPL